MPPGIPTFAVYEEQGRYVYYRPSSTQTLATFDRERDVIASARASAAAIGATEVRVVLIIPVTPSS
jgi:hypothetical protein